MGAGALLQQGMHIWAMLYAQGRSLRPAPGCYRLRWVHKARESTAQPRPLLVPVSPKGNGALGGWRMCRPGSPTQWSWKVGRLVLAVVLVAPGPGRPQHLHACEGQRMAQPALHLCTLSSVPAHSWWMASFNSWGLTRSEQVARAHLQRVAQLLACDAGAVDAAPLLGALAVIRACTVRCQ